MVAAAGDKKQQQLQQPNVATAAARLKNPHVTGSISALLVCLAGAVCSLSNQKVLSEKHSKNI